MKKSKSRSEVLASFLILIFIYISITVLVLGFFLLISYKQKITVDFTNLISTATILLPITFLVSFEVIRSDKQNEEYKQISHSFVTIALIVALMTFILGIISSFASGLGSSVVNASMVLNATLSLYASISVCALILLTLLLGYFKHGISDLRDQ